MSYIVKRLPEIERLQHELEQYPTNIVYYSKYGGYIGSTESMEYLNKKLEEHYDSK
jgi:hypothetical protein